MDSSIVTTNVLTLLPRWKSYIRYTKCDSGDCALPAGQTSEVQEVQLVMEPKRARTHASTADDDEEYEKHSCDDMDLADYHRESRHIQNRHSIPLGSRAEVPTPQEDHTVPLQYSRLGLVGCIANWSLHYHARFLRCFTDPLIVWTF